MNDNTLVSWIPIEQGLPEYDYENPENNTYPVKLNDGSYAEANLTEYVDFNGMHIRFFECEGSEAIVEYQASLNNTAKDILINTNKQKVIDNLADILSGEINRICVTDDLAELDTMYQHAQRNLQKLAQTVFDVRFRNVPKDLQRIE